MKQQKTQKGMHKIEFYAALNEIKDLYFNGGFVIYKILYDKLKNKYNWEMTYNTFIIYAKREKLTLHSNSKKNMINDSKVFEKGSLDEAQEIKLPKKKPPIFVTVGGEDKDDFFTKNDIPEDRKL